MDAVRWGLVDNYLHLGTRLGMKVQIEKVHSCRMALMFCVQRELAKVISDVLGYLEASECVIRLSMHWSSR